MRPIYLELQAFGPYVEKQCIDFEKLSRNGIFLIKGKTGSGKTTIFDAMTVALYGGSSGDSAARNDFGEWRCRQADWSTETYVSFTFEVKGAVYRFTRRLVPRRVNLGVVYEAGTVALDGTVIPFFNNPKQSDLRQKAEEIIGLTKDQFRQVVLLPQGQFERFLVASAGEKEEILQRIFDENRWRRYSETLFRNAKARQESLARDKEYIDRSLQEEELTTLEELSQKIVTLQGQRDEKVKAHAAFDGEKKTEELTKDRRLFESFRPLHDLERENSRLEGLREEYSKKRTAYDQAEKAERLRPFIDEYERREKELRDRAGVLSGKSALLPGREKALADAEAAKKLHEEQSIVAERNRLLAEYEAKRPVYESYAELVRNSREAAKACETAVALYKTAETEFNASSEEAAAQYAALSEAEKEASLYRDRYFSGIYGELAAGLKDGEKCPVCGSIAHPEPAERTPDSVTREQWDAKEKAKEKIRKAWDKAEKDRSAKEKAKSGAFADEQKKLAAKQTAEAALESGKNSLIEGIADLAALDRAKKKCSEELEEYNAKTKQLEDAVTGAKQARDELKAQIGEAEREKNNAGESLSRAEADLTEALKTAGYEDYRAVKGMLVSASERTRMHESIVAYDTSCANAVRDLAAKRAELAGKTEPDSSRFAARQQEIEEEAKGYNSAIAGIDAFLERLGRKLGNLSELEANYRENIREAESDLAFAKKVRGDSGIGLQRYVLAIMFNKVLEEANRMLKNVHGGRYSLFRTNDRVQGNQRGLELKVRDTRSPEDTEGRPVGMLSGGEKFLVSLALSIGMSTVAQKTGVEIDALFIDEGFGTLDENSINDAMAILESVRKGNGMIGIISHVALLESTIPDKLEVVKEDSRNWIRAV